MTLITPSAIRLIYFLNLLSRMLIIVGTTFVFLSSGFIHPWNTSHFLPAHSHATGILDVLIIISSHRIDVKLLRNSLRTLSDLMGGYSFELKRAAEKT